MALTTMESSFLCCSLRTGTKIIAWIHTVLFVIGLLIVMIFFFLLSSVTKEVNQQNRGFPKDFEGNDAFFNNSQKENSDFVNFIAGIGYTVLAVCALILLLHLVTAILLLLGAHHERAGYMMPWLVLAVISLFLSLLRFDLTSLGYFIINLYFTWVVSSYYKQLKVAEYSGGVMRRGNDPEFGHSLVSPSAPPPYAYPQK